MYKHINVSQAHSFSRRGRRPASIEDTRSPIQHSPTDYGSNRELLKSRTHSAPTSPWQGNVQSVAMLGEKPSRDMLRERQQRYAEELRQQIAEKREVNARNRTHDEAAKDERKPAPILKVCNACASSVWYFSCCFRMFEW